jgi:2-oxoglutarate ferredoxin oxidoreductase subunit alpha
MSDLELGMNDNLSEPLQWDDQVRYDRGKVLDSEALESSEVFGRYLDVDGDGIGYRTLPGTHPEKGAFFTRGTSRDEFAAYTESPEAYERNMQRLELKWQTIRGLVPNAEIEDQGQRIGVLFYGTTALPMPEALDLLHADGIALDSCRVRAFPFGSEVEAFVQAHDLVFVVEQNRDAQMRTLLINELQTAPAKLVPVLYYAGLSISADTIHQQINEYFTANKLSRISEVQS